MLMNSRRNRKKVSGGFSMVEMMFSVASLAVASLGVLSVLTFGSMSGDAAGTFSEATQMSREVIENIRVDRFTFDPFNPPAGLVDTDLNARTELTAPPFDSTAVSLPANTRFKRNIQITEVEADRLARITVRIYWEQQTSAKAGIQEKFVETSAYVRSGL